jgi:hypothetical protein
MTMNRYLAALIIFLFVVMIGDTLLSGLIGFLAFTSHGDMRLFTALDFVAMLISISLGITLAVERVRSRQPWRLTPLRKAIIFVLLDAALQQIWQDLVFSYTASILFGGAPVPSSETLNLFFKLYLVIRLPTSLIFYLPLQEWLNDYSFVTFFINGALWVMLFYAALMATRRFKAYRKRKSSATIAT